MNLQLNVCLFIYCTNGLHHFTLDQEIPQLQYFLFSLQIFEEPPFADRPIEEGISEKFADTEKEAFCAMKESDDSLFSEVGNFVSKNEKLHDVYFLVGDKKERIGAVRLFLINHSRVWWSMLSPESPLVETADIHLPDIEPATFKLLLKHCYGGLDDLRDLSEDTVVQLCYCADKYLMASLARKIETRLQPANVDQLFAALLCLTRYNLHGVKNAVTRIVQTQSKKLFAHPKFIKLDLDYIVFISQQDELNCKELELWRAIVKWAKNKVDRSDNSKLRQIMSEPLKHIRLLTLTDAELRLAFADGILNSTEVIKVFVQDLDGLEDICVIKQLRKRPQPSNYLHRTWTPSKTCGQYSAGSVSSSCIAVGKQDIFLKSVTCRNYLFFENNKKTLTEPSMKMDTEIKIKHITNHINNTSSETPVVIKLTQLKGSYFDQFNIPTVVNDRGVLLKANCRYSIDLNLSKSTYANYMISRYDPECDIGHDFEHGTFYCSLNYNNGKGVNPCHILQFDYSIDQNDDSDSS